MYKAPPPEALARVVRWGILIFIAYAILTGGFKNHPQQPPRPVGVGNTANGMQANTSPDCNEGNPLKNFSMLAMSLMPSIIPSERIHDIKPGDGSAAVCGQYATFHYNYTLENGSPVFSNYDSPKYTTTFIGDPSLLRGLSLGLVGMKAGGEREIEFPASLGAALVKDSMKIRDADHFTVKMQEIQNAILKAKISLVSLSPELPVSSFPLRVIDHQFTSGARAMCGDTVRVGMTIWKMNGDKIFSTLDNDKPLVFRAGESAIPYGIEQSVIGMTENAQRLVILPPAYAKPLLSDAKSDNVLSKVVLPAEAILVEISLQHIGEETPAPAHAASVAPSGKTPDSISPQHNP